MNSGRVCVGNSLAVGVGNLGSSVAESRYDVTAWRSYDVIMERARLWELRL